jgi:Protease inhibitor Inh
VEWSRKLSYHRRMLNLRIAALIAAVIALPAGVCAQGTQPSEEAKEMAGSWEISNADRDKLCTVTLTAEPAPGGMKLAFEPACAEAFEVTKNIRAWRLNKDGLQFVDAKGRALIHLDEVEKGMFEGMRPGEGRYFVQSLAAVRAEAQPEQVLGEWQVSRGTDEAICVITFSNKPAGENFSLQLKPGCGALVTGFNPTSWHLDRGELVLSSARGAWRFEEAGEIAWRRVPEGTDPLWLVRQVDVQPSESGGG